MNHCSGIIGITIRLCPAIITTLAGLFPGIVNGNEIPTLARARRLLEFEQAVLAENEGWDYLLSAAAGESRHALLTRESRLPHSMLMALVRNADQTPRMRAIGLRYLPTESLQRRWVEQLLSGQDTDLQREVVFSLQASKAEWRDELLRGIAADSERPTRLRAEAVLGLAAHADHPLNTHLLLRLAVSGNRTLRIESLRALRGRALENAGVRNALLRQIESCHPDGIDESAQFEIDEQLVQALAGIGDRNQTALRTLRARVQHERPATLEDWQTKLQKGGDAAAGRRVFFHPKAGHCSRCHRADGRGGTIASDLTSAGRSASRRSLIESIVDPDKAIPGPFIRQRVSRDRHR